MLNDLTLYSKAMVGGSYLSANLIGLISLSFYGLCYSYEI
jgi:hypothetical protein